jgi:hypothetical protein
MRNWLDARTATTRARSQGLGFAAIRPAFFGKQVHRPSVCLTVLAHIGDLVEPDLCGWIHGREIGELGAVQEVFLHIPDAGFDPTPLVSGGNVARGNLEGVMAPVIDIAWIEHRGGAGKAAQDGGLQVILAGTPSTAKARS